MEHCTVSKCRSNPVLKFTTLCNVATFVFHSKRQCVRSLKLRKSMFSYILPVPYLEIENRAMKPALQVCFSIAICTAFIWFSATAITECVFHYAMEDDIFDKESIRGLKEPNIMHGEMSNFPISIVCNQQTSAYHKTRSYSST